MNESVAQRSGCVCFAFGFNFFGESVRGRITPLYWTNGVIPSQRYASSRSITKTSDRSSYPYIKSNWVLTFCHRTGSHEDDQTVCHNKRTFQNSSHYVNLLSHNFQNNRQLRHKVNQDILHMLVNKPRLKIDPSCIVRYSHSFPIGGLVLWILCLSVCLSVSLSLSLSRSTSVDDKLHVLAFYYCCHNQRGQKQNGSCPYAVVWVYLPCVAI